MVGLSLGTAAVGCALPGSTGTASVLQLQLSNPAFENLFSVTNALWYFLSPKAIVLESCCNAGRQ